MGNNVFNALRGKSLYRPINTIIGQKKGFSSQKMSLVQAWKKDPSKENTQKVLEYLNPTIQSALHSYVPGQQQQFKLKAASMALQALKGYDKTKSSSPSTYVFTNLQRLNRVRRQRQNPIHIPQSQVYAKTQLDKKIAQLEDSLGREPSDQEICDYVKISKKKLQSLQSRGATVSQSAVADSQTGSDLLGDKGLSDKDYYNYVYDSVSPVDQKIMQWSSGYGKVQLSNNEIASKLHLSPGAVSQHKARIQELIGQVRGLL